MFSTPLLKTSFLGHNKWALIPTNWMDEARLDRPPSSQMSIYVHVLILLVSNFIHVTQAHYIWALCKSDTVWWV